VEERRTTLGRSLWRPRAPGFGCAWLDPRPGAFTVLQGEGRQALAPPSSSGLTGPRSCCYAEGAGVRAHRASGHGAGGCVRVAPSSSASASRLLTDQLGTLDLKGFGADDLAARQSVPPGRCCSTCATHRSRRCRHIRTDVEERSEALMLDAAAAAISSSTSAERAPTRRPLFRRHRQLRHRHGLTAAAPLAQPPADTHPLLARPVPRPRPP